MLAQRATQADLLPLLALSGCCGNASKAPKDGGKPKFKLTATQHQGISSAMAVASPPPMQSAAAPRFKPYFCKAATSVTTILAPDAPIGWPSAQAPPCTLTFSCGKESSCIAAMATTAKASLISKRSTS